MRSSLRIACSFLVAWLPIAATGQAKHTSLRSKRTVSPRTEVWANVSARLKRVSAGAHGTVWLIVSADYAGAAAAPGAPTSLTIRIPLSSSEDLYGESRSCSARADGSLDLVFNAGLDEPNFIRFVSSTQSHDFHLMLNKYLCRALASPFHCAGHEVSVPQDWSGWRLSRALRVAADPASSTTIDLGSLDLQATRKPFDRARCAVVAPSNGLCCVAGRVTEWHCGGTPAGAGWHQVSGECFHRETGGSCKD